VAAFGGLTTFKMVVVAMVTRCFMKFDERDQIVLKNPPFFISMATAAKFVLPIPIFFWLISFHWMWM
jgi:hypothetical protein